MADPVADLGFGSESASSYASFRLSRRITSRLLVRISQISLATDRLTGIIVATLQSFFPTET